MRARKLNPSASALAHFGSELRHYRTVAGYSQEQVGRACVASAQLVGHIETARRMPSLDFAQRADEFLGTSGALERLWRDLVSHEAHPTYFQPFAEIEASATLLRQFEPLAVPGLLQTEEYARTLLTRPSATTEQIEELVAARMERQSILDGDSPPTLVVLLDESVLSRVVGSPEVMRAQLEALLEASKRSKVVVQVVPESSGADAALAGMFTIASTDGDEVAYFETVATGHLVDRSEDVAECVAFFEALRAEALSRRDSLDLIRKRKEEYEL